MVICEMIFKKIGGGIRGVGGGRGGGTGDGLGEVYCGMSGKSSFVKVSIKSNHK